MSLVWMGRAGKKCSKDTKVTLRMLTSELVELLTNWKQGAKPLLIKPVIRDYSITSRCQTMVKHTAVVVACLIRWINVKKFQVLLSVSVFKKTCLGYCISIGSLNFFLHLPVWPARPVFWQVEACGWISQKGKDCSCNQKDYIVLPIHNLLILTTISIDKPLFDFTVWSWYFLM